LVSPVSASLNRIGSAIKQYSPGVKFPPEPISQPATKITIAMLDQMGSAFGDFHILENLGLCLGGRLGSARPHQLSPVEKLRDHRCEFQRATDNSDDAQLARSPINIETAAATAANAVE